VEEPVAVRSALGEAPQERHGFGQDRLLVFREVICDRGGEPPLAMPAVGLERGKPTLGQRYHRAAAIVRIGSARNIPVGLEIADGLSHRLRPDALGDGEVADALRALAVEPAEHGTVRERERVLDAEPADELPDHDPQLARHQRLVDLCPHIPTIATLPGKLNRLPVYSQIEMEDRYKWIALSNCTLGVLLATLDASITLIAMPDIFRGIHLDPLVPSNSFYLLWMILGYMVVASVLIVSLGRLGDMFGRVKIYNLGFLIYTVASLLLTINWMSGRAGATYLIVFRVVQGIGGACLLANSAAIITDAFPANQRGMALGINNIVGVSGMFVGLVLGGLLAPINWRLVFLISVPVGLFATVWAYLKLEERSKPRRRPIDWWGNISFALGLICLMIAITYGIRPYGDHSTGWTSPRVIVLLAAAVVSLTAFVLVERSVRDPMFRLPLFRIRAFTFGTLSTFLSAVARGGLMFILIIWLQGIWLPQHGYDFTKTPLWAGIYMLPLTIGMLFAGPTSGYLSDRFGARGFATGGMIGAAISFGLLLLLPTDFGYPVFAVVLALNGISMGLFASPNRAAVMNSLPPGDRGAGGGMNQTFQNSAQVISIGIFFSLMIAGLSATLPHTMSSGLEAHGVGAATAQHVANLPPVSILFAAFLGYNPIQHLVGPHALGLLDAHSRAVITGQTFFPQLISGPFRSGLHEAFAFAIVACLVAAAASLMRGGRYHHVDEPGGRGLNQVAPPPVRARPPAPTRAEEQHAR
jgi:EmrB/QacA subfamily drug resistance transporter